MFRLKVREVAESKGVSQRQLFLQSSVDITTIRKVFRDPQTVVTVETLTRLAKVLEVDVSQLIESVPDEDGKAPVRTKKASAKVKKAPAKANKAPDQDDKALDQVDKAPEQDDKAPEQVDKAPDQTDNASAQ